MERREVRQVANDQGAFSPRELFQRGADDAALCQRWVYNKSGRQHMSKAELCEIRAKHWRVRKSERWARVATGGGCQDETRRPTLRLSVTSVNRVVS